MIELHVKPILCDALFHVASCFRVATCFRRPPGRRENRRLSWLLLYITPQTAWAALLHCGGKALLAEEPSRESWWASRKMQEHSRKRALINTDSILLNTDCTLLNTDPKPKAFVVPKHHVTIYTFPPPWQPPRPPRLLDLVTLACLACSTLSITFGVAVRFRPALAIQFPYTQAC